MNKYLKIKLLQYELKWEVCCTIQVNLSTAQLLHPNDVAGVNFKSGYG